MAPRTNVWVARPWSHNIFPVVFSANRNITGKKWSLEKYSKWYNNTWKLINGDPKNEMAILIINTHLLIVGGSVTYECYSLAQNNHDIMVSCKEKTHVFYTRCHDSGLKFRVLFKSITDARDCAEELKKYIQVNDEGSKIEKKEETYSEILTRLVKDGSKNNFPAPSSIPDDYPLESAIKLCILDPGFPQFVSKVEKVVNNFTSSS